MSALKRFGLALLVATAGCATSRPLASSDPFATGDGRASSVRIEVQNLNFTQARLYAIRDGQRLNLGTVEGKQDDDFTMEWLFSHELRIEINMLAGPTCTTEPMVVDPGDILQLQISPVFSQSSFCR
jgi:hypothetical protein